MITRRALTTFLCMLAVNLVASVPASAEDFEAEYDELIEQFGTSLPDSAAAQAQVDRADDLYDRIRQHRKDHREDLSKAELDRLKALYVEVRRFKAVARVVGQVSNGAYTSIEAFDTVQERLSLEPKVILTHESGLELVRIDLGEFGSILIRNPTKMTVTVMYSVNDPERPGGVGSSFCESYAVMSGLFNSRDRKIEGVEFTLNVRDTGAGNCD